MNGWLHPCNLKFSFLRGVRRRHTLFIPLGEIKSLQFKPSTTCIYIAQHSTPMQSSGQPGEPPGKQLGGLTQGPKAVPMEGDPEHLLSGLVTVEDEKRLAGIETGGASPASIGKGVRPLTGSGPRKRNFESGSSIQFHGDMFTAVICSFSLSLSVDLLTDKLKPQRLHFPSPGEWEIGLLFSTSAYDIKKT